MVLSGNTSSFTIKSYAIEKTIPTACVRRLLYKKNGIPKTINITEFQYGQIKNLHYTQNGNINVDIKFSDFFCDNLHQVLNIKR